MIVSQCCGAPLDPNFEEPICNDCKEHCDTYDDEDVNDGDQERDQNADSE